MNRRIVPLASFLVIITILPFASPSFATATKSQPATVTGNQTSNSNCMDSIQTQLMELHRGLDKSKAVGVARGSGAYQKAIHSHSAKLLEGITDDYHYDSNCQITSINYGVNFALTDSHGKKSTLEIFVDKSLSTVVNTLTNPEENSANPGAPAAAYQTVGSLYSEPTVNQTGVNATSVVQPMNPDMGTYQTIGGTNTPYEEGYLLFAQSFVPATDHTVYYLGVWATQVFSYSRVILMLYTDSGGIAGQLLGQTDIINVAQTNIFVNASLLSPVSISAGVRYWLAVEVDGPGGQNIWMTFNAGNSPLDYYCTWNNFGSVPQTYCNGYYDQGWTSAYYYTLVGYTPLTPPNFEWYFLPLTGDVISAPQGCSGTGTIGVVLNGAWTPGPVSLSVSGLPAGVTSDLNPSVGIPNPSFTTVLTISPSTNTPLGDYPFTLDGVGGGHQYSLPLTLHVIDPSLPFDFSLSESDTSFIIKQGQSAYNYMGVLWTAGCPVQTVQLSATGTPPDSTVTFEYPSGTPSFTSGLHIYTSPSTTPGNYTVTVTGTASGGLQHSSQFWIVVQLPPPSPTSVFSGYQYWADAMGNTPVYKATSTWTQPTVTQPAFDQCVLKACDATIWTGLESTYAPFPRYLAQTGTDWRIHGSVGNGWLWWGIYPEFWTPYESMILCPTAYVYPGDSITSQTLNEAAIGGSVDYWDLQTLDNTHQYGCGVTAYWFPVFGYAPNLADFLLERPSFAFTLVGLELPSFTTFSFTTSTMYYNGATQNVWKSYKAGYYNRIIMSNWGHTNTAVGNTNSHGTFSEQYVTYLGTELT